jgi:uncharacterized protein (TIGR00725 family)
MARKIVVGVMGPGQPNEREEYNARALGKAIAQNGWALLTGGRATGVMDAASQAAQEAGGLVVGVLPDADTTDCSDFVDIAIITDMGSARNNINVLSSDVVIACGMGSGTASEVALALKAGQTVILLTDHEESQRFFSALKPGCTLPAESAAQAIELAKGLLAKRHK